MKAVEVNFDGLVGPTHNYSGLSYGNVASQNHKQLVSNPKEAALQGLEKMKFLMNLGLVQGIIPPQERPHIPTLRSLGFEGTDEQILLKAYETSPELVFACGSAAAMWTANAATVSPSLDTRDGKIHFMPANLSNKFHRSIEAPFTQLILKKYFNNPQYFTVHSPLPQGNYFSDEGAANHNRFCDSYEKAGIELFVYGKNSLKNNIHLPKKFPARQTLEASQAIVRKHQLDENKVIFAQQNPKAIDAGVFHNDVIAVANKNVFFLHEEAFTNTQEIISELKKKIPKLILIFISSQDLSIEEAVQAYLFNSQLISVSGQKMRLIAPMECKNNPKIELLLQEMIANDSNPVAGVDFMDLKQSMANGGGPACLRLRVVMTESELKAAHPTIFLTNQLYIQLKNWIEKYYRDRLYPEDLADPSLLQETRHALEDLTRILELGYIYPFQTNGVA